MYKYTCICLKDNRVCYNKIKFLTDVELIEQKIYWGVNSFSELIQRWNQQIESSITKLKWIYHE